MSSTPTFTSAPVCGLGSVVTANTNRDGTGTIAQVVPAAPAAGIKIDRLVIQATGNPADSIVTIFIFDGTTWWLFDEIDIGDPAAASTTVPGYRFEKAYYNLVLPSGFKLGAAVTVALTAGALNVIAFGGALT